MFYSSLKWKTLYSGDGTTSFTHDALKTATEISILFGYGTTERTFPTDIMYDNGNNIYMIGVDFTMYYNGGWYANKSDLILNKATGTISVILSGGLQYTQPSPMLKISYR